MRRIVMSVWTNDKDLIEAIKEQRRKLEAEKRRQEEKDALRQAARGYFIGRLSAEELVKMREKQLKELGHKSPEVAQNDRVNHPSHYTQGGIECIDAITAALSCHRNPVNAWLTGQVIKYLWRWPLKNGKEDLRKAEWYLHRLLQRLEEQDKCDMTK